MSTRGGNGDANGSALPGYVRALLDPAAYPHNPPDVELIQTHISYVFLAGDVVYKTKKPVDLGFINQVDLETREQNCHAEIRLNSRLAPAVGIGVVPVVQHADGHFEIDPPGDPGDPGDATVVEWAVKMHRLSEDRTLQALLEAGEVPPRILERLVAKLIRFHEAAPAVPADPAFAGAEALRRWWAEEYREAENFIGDTWDESDARELQQFITGTIDREADLFDQRLADGRVVEGHGDLRAQHVYVFGDDEDDIQVVDCIEFSEAFQFRYQDVGYEVAFLAMDLEARGWPELSEEFVGRYVAASGDETLGLLQPFYRALRAFVRGKVESMGASEAEVNASQREALRRSARHYFHLASSYVNRQAGPVLLVLSGPSGTGKSTVGATVAGRAGAAYINSDSVRKTLAGIHRHDRASTDFQEGIYSEEMTRKTYDEMRRRAAAHLQRGRPVVLDAVHPRREDRTASTEVARADGMPHLVVSFILPGESALERIATRRHDPMATSDATEDVYQQQIRSYEPVDESSEGGITIDASESASAQARRIAAWLPNAQAGAA